MYTHPWARTFLAILLFTLFIDVKMGCNELIFSHLEINNNDKQ
nr:MAG TPA: hypothetical protein [Caudoviricetes sp.]